VLILLVPRLVSRADLVLASNAGIYSLFALGICAILSYAGQFSVAQSIFALIASYVMAILTTRYRMALPLAALRAVVAAGAAAAIAGAVLLRLKGFYFAISTLLLSSLGSLLAADLLSEWTRGTQGIMMPIARVGPFSILNLAQRYYVIWGVVFVASLFFRNIDRTRSVRAARAVKANEGVAQLVGINPWRTKLVMFVMSGVLAGLATVFAVASIQFVDPYTFDIDLSILIFVAVVLGGRSTFWGALVGGVFITVLNQSLTTFQQRATILYGLALILVITLLPGGLAGIFSSLRAWLFHRDELIPAIVPTRAPADRAEVRTSADGAGLELRGLGVVLGGTRILRGVSITTHPGNITALMGPNGAGKTTVLNAVTGFVPITEGRVLLNGRDITGKSIYAIRRAGVARTLQIPYLFTELTTWENVAVGFDFRCRHGVIASGLGWPGAARAERAIKDKALVLVERVGLLPVTNRKAAQLSFGQRRLVEIARAMAGDAAAVLFDEPFAGLSPAMVDQVKELLLDLRAAGRTVLLIDHDLGHIGSIADVGVFMVDGEISESGPISAVLQSEAVMRQYVGV
jgi:ABC-type branched-subunit amino acid transport system ATPase component/ABC-type branched-subunit amino acid transport system permease subunit